MNKETKLRFHLEHIIFEDLPEGAALDNTRMDILCTAATEEQKERAFQRGLVHCPLLLDDEREGR